MPLLILLIVFALLATIFFFIKAFIEAGVSSMKKKKGPKWPQQN